MTLIPYLLPTEKLGKKRTKSLATSVTVSVGKDFSKANSNQITAEKVTSFLICLVAAGLTSDKSVTF